MTSRHSFTMRIGAFFQDRPLVWIPATELEQFGRQAWRTRLSDARRRYGLRIENRVRKVRRSDGTLYVKSEYRYVPADLLECAKEIAS